jgi:hypothetical protein
MKLIYQLPDANGENIKPSPFDTAISELVKGKSIQVACPYIGVKYFKDIIINGCRDWELLTDLKALVKSQGDGKNIEKMRDFLEEFSKKIKHQDNLHAKVIIAEDRALIGSANFTHNGIYENKEISVIISDPEKVNEIKSWYNELWQHATELTKEELTEWISRVKEYINYVEKEHLRSDIPNISFHRKTETNYEQRSSEHIEINQKIEKDITKINYNIETSQIKNDAKKIEVDRTHEQMLIKCLKKLDRKKIYTEQYFDLAQYIVEKFNIKEQDERFCFSIPKNFDKIAIIADQRIILVQWLKLKFFNKQIGLIMPLEFDQKNARLEGWKGWNNKGNYYPFKPKQRESEPEAYEIRYKKTGEVKFNDITMSEWDRAVEDELRRIEKRDLEKGLFRDYHRPTLYKFICDKKYRNYILDQVY